MAWAMRVCVMAYSSIALFGDDAEYLTFVERVKKGVVELPCLPLAIPFTHPHYFCTMFLGNLFSMKIHALFSYNVAKIQ